MDKKFLYVPTKKYVYYDEEGNITSITNRIVSDDPYIEVENSDVKPITSGQDQMTNYFVEFDTLTKQYLFKHKKINNKSFVSIRDNVHQITKENSENYDLKIIRDNINKQWIFKLDTELRENLKETYSRYAQTMNFSITREDEPHNLYQMVKIKVKDLIVNKDVKIPFVKEKFFDNKEISVYTVRKFRTYSYEEINE